LPKIILRSIIIYRKSVGSIAVILAGLVTLTGCSAGGDDAPDPEETMATVSLDGYQDVTAKLDFEHASPALPLDQYSMNSSEYVHRVLHAIAVSTDACMTEQGYPAVAQTVDWAPYPAEDRTYGVWSISYATKYGLDSAPQSGPPAVDTVNLGVDFNKAYPLCMDEAKGQLMDQLTFSQEPNVDSRIRGRAIDLVVASEEGKSALTAWQSCMEQAGLVLDPEDGRPSAQYAAQGKEAEITATVTEAQCGADSGATQTLYDLQAQYEQAFMDQQAAQLQDFSVKRNKAIDVFDNVIAGR